MVNLEKALDFVKKIALEVGSYQIEKLDRNIAIDTKANVKDLVTAVDRHCEKIIKEKLMNAYPLVGFIGEEGGSTDKKEYMWAVDPLDGTTNYVQGLPLFCVSIGLMRNDDFILGVVYTPKTDELFYAAKGYGAYLNDKPIKVSNTEKIENAIVATGFAYTRYSKSKKPLDLLNRLVIDARGVRRMGAAAYDLCCVAAGKMDAFYEIYLGIWDVAAGIAIIQEAGGTFKYLEGCPNVALLAGTPVIYEKLDRMIKESPLW